MKYRLVLFDVLVFGASLSLTSCVSTPGLNAAAATNDTGATLKLLANGANPNEFDSGGNTPLVVAVTGNNVYLVNILLAHGADPNMATKYGIRPLPIAVEKGYIYVVKLLLRYGANPTFVHIRREIPGNEAQRESYNLVLAAQNLPLLPPPPPTHEELLQKLGEQANVAQAKGEPRKAFRIYLSILRQDPDYAPLKSTYNTYKRAIEVSRKVKPLPPLSEAYRREIVVGLANVKDAKTREDYLKALGHFVKASRIAPWSPVPYEALGHISETLGDYASAAGYFKLYLLASPNAPNARAIRDHVYVLEDKAGRKD